MSDNLKVFDRIYVSVAGFKVKDENGNVLTFTKKEYPTYTVTLTSSGQSSQGYVEYNNIKYYTSGQTFSANENDVVKVYVGYGDRNVISLNGEVVSQSYGQVEYSHTVTSDIEINFSLSRGQSDAYITEISDIAALTITENGTYTASGTTRGYSPITVSVPTRETINNQDKSVTPSESTQMISADSGYTGLGTVTVGAISSSYIGSGITQRTSTDLTSSGATVTVPSGYYANQATKSVASGTEGTPTATKGTVNNHQVSITPSVTNTAGYISGGTRTGTAVTVTAAELASGNKEITENGTNIDVVGYSTVSVDVSGSSYTSWQTLYDGTTSITASSPNYIVIPNYTIPLQADETYRITWGETTYTFQTKVDTRGVSYDGYFVGNSVVIGGTDDGSGIALLLYRDTATRMLGVTTDTGTKYLKIEKQITTSANLQTKTNISPTTSSQIITADVGYDGLSSVQINAMPSGTEGTPVASKGTISNHTISITPSVTNSEGYISGGTRTGTAVTVTARELVQGTTLYMDAGAGEYNVTNAETFVVDEGAAGTPTASKGTVSNHSISVTPTVTNVSGYIDGGTKTGTAVSVSASELVSGTYNVTSSGTKDVTNYASISVGAGTEGTPTATKGTVSNHSVSITPSVTNSGGYITGSTKTGTAVTVSASELVSGSQTITENGTVNVTNLASVNVAIPVVTYYTGTSEPVASQYNDGDIYLKVVSN